MTARLTSDDERADRIREARDALLGAMFSDGLRVWEIVALDATAVNGDPLAWLLADIANPVNLDPRSRPSKRELHRVLFADGGGYVRVGFGTASS